MKESTKYILRETSKFIIAAFSVILFMLIVAYILNAAHGKLDKYAETHNCRYDYNGFCYTQEERPWLF